MERTDPSTIPQIAGRLRLLRRAITGNQAEFARMLGFSRNAWNNVEVGSARIGINMALTLRRKFGVTLDWVYVGDEAMMPHHLMVQIDRLGAEESQSPS